MVTSSLARARGERIDQTTAVARATEILADGLHLQLPDAAPSETRAIVTVRDLAEAWLGAQKLRVGVEIRQSTWIGYRDKAVVLAREPIAEVPLRAVTQDHLLAVLKRLRGRLADQTVAVTMVAFAAMWRWGVEIGACDEVRWPRWKFDRPVAPMPLLDDVMATLEHLQQNKDRGVRMAQLCVAIPVLIGTGARPGEVARSRVDDLDLHAATWVIRPGPGAKTGRRVVPLNRQCVGILRTHVDGMGREAPLFPPAAGTRSILSIWRKAIVRSAEAAGVERWQLKGLRHLAVSRMVASGMDVATIASITGHSAEVLLKTYAHPFEDRRRAAVEGLSVPRGLVIPLPKQGGG